ncbi:MAG: aminotransferase class I/II-fold pyridoxal phosphate-dependent enzyme [Thermodesulfobacteriota bacterium]|nr:aminotransferase class I/II-fold pyridoxal phosphate-dependent enzyme [Thermodesulfobacteriota bacterium]
MLPRKFGGRRLIQLWYGCHQFNCAYIHWCRRSCCFLDELYGGTHAFATDTFNRLGIQYSFVPTSADAIKQATTPATKAILIESPTNPLLNIIDIRAVAAFARQNGIITIVDNTFATPINQNPLSFGVDVVVHSGTKYLGGHSDLCCGVVLTSHEYSARIRATACHLGGSVNAVTSYLLERSLKTLALRVERQSQNALHIAEFLSDHPLICNVNYPGLPNFRGHETAKKQMKRFGGMLSFELDEERVEPTQFLSRLQLIRPAVSLGGIETIICSPAQTSHVKMSVDERKRVGISNALLRLSVGIEHVNDLIADLEQAMSG